ncbi:MAG: hypothetical protein JWN01_1235 [Patescibacteria group bacterium]|nr:hypothetical protein [Patescibacteria group bacterium]
MNQPPISEVTHHYAGVFLVTASGKIIGQQRDNKPGIDNPNRIGSFGGTIEDGEDPLAGAWRELVEEETNLEISKEDVHLYSEDVAWRKLTNEWEGRHFYYAKITDAALDQLEVYEGQGWAVIESPEDKLVIDLWREPVKKLQMALKKP